MKDITKLSKYLTELYPDASCELTYKNSFELLIATILSAQTTDKQVNRVTPILFMHFSDAKALANASSEEVENIIKSIGFYKVKAKNIIRCAQNLVHQYDGLVPNSMDELIKLSGVGRKTANVVLGNAFGINAGFVVDTHISRIAQRLGISKHSKVEKIEFDLMNSFPQHEWHLYAHRMIHFGRNICKAQKPLCECCKMTSICSFYKTN